MTTRNVIRLTATECANEDTLHGPSPGQGGLISQKMPNPIAYNRPTTAPTHANKDTSSFIGMRRTQPNSISRPSVQQQRTQGV